MRQQDLENIQVFRIRLKMVQCFLFQCDFCDASYVGYTACHLHQRVAEHKRSAKKDIWHQSITGWTFFPFVAFSRGGESGWRSGHHSRFPPLRPGIDSRGPHVGGDLSISIWLRGFFSLRLCSEVMHGPYSSSQGRLYMLSVRPRWAALPL